MQIDELSQKQNGSEKTKKLMHYTDEIYLKFGADTNLHGTKHIEEIKEIKKKAVKIVYTSANYHKNCMYVRNRHLVDYSSWCIAYCRKNEGGTAYTVLYAEEKQCRVLYFPAECRRFHSNSLPRCRLFRRDGRHGWR